jgi:pSer/pThr/pTyr-binding forkhead associated (FHA) protein
MINRSIDQFFEGCEAERPLRLLARPVADGGAGREPTRFSLGTPFAVLGRSPAADLVLDDPRLSRRHCFLQVLGPKVLCVDLASAAGVLGARGRTLCGWIGPGKGVRVGDHVLTLDDGTDDPTALVGGGGPEQPLIVGAIPRINLEFRTNRVQTRWPMRRAIALVGSASTCGVRLNGPNVSRFHCALVRTTTGLWAVDLLGDIDVAHQSGISVNGDPVRSARIGPNDRLRVAQFEIRAYYPRSARGASLPVLTESRSARASGAANPAAVTPDLDSAGLVEQARAELEARFERLVERQSAEIEALRREVEDLRELAEDLRTRLGGRRGTHAGLSTYPRKEGNARKRRPVSRATSVRVLGSAARDPQTASPQPELASNVSAVVSAGFPIRAELAVLVDVGDGTRNPPNHAANAPTANQAVNRARTPVFLAETASS